MSGTEAALRWQTGVWDAISERYVREIDVRFAEVVRGCVQRASLQSGDVVLDLGTGTGSVAVAASGLVGVGGAIVGVDISPEMLRLAGDRCAELGLTNVDLRDGRAEQVPADDASFDVLIACLSYMYVADRARAAQEAARVLRPGGRFVAAVWAAADRADIVRFQQTAGSFAPAPPVPGVGPGALGDPAVFLEQLSAAGIVAEVSTGTVEFAFDDLGHAWDILAAVTTAGLDREKVIDAKDAVRAAMWPDAPHGPRVFRNEVQFIVGERGS